ncbi:hydroxymethylbilane synthase [Siphonobacter sp. SORGH_AS_1065]|uniref:hydroxymethylbilane synthase n=1 Tax=Siphonobacter sp. SORGH_AS_1065 TaxID=3041795 RepID=UPI002781BFB5|nr:hydroxymethylbilane synthase [Siphonobacter sp. SORGH_AS_1065]MDQ1086051.1 hydroxymethylbilane synthase [Siphonobacter sp. SORGH_AS_1065]
MKVRIGSRGSKLALWQAEYVAEQLRLGGMEPEIVVIDTKGDKILDRSLSKIGSKGVFTEELEEQLRTGAIDIAQHSAKDLQSSLADDLEIIAFTPREAVNDVLISFNPELSLESGETFVVGTSSTRRVATLKRYYPHIKVVDMRGNLQTRLDKLKSGVCDALILAYAGVHRMGYEEYIAEHLSTETFTPAVGQGSVAIECATSLDADKKARIRELLNDPVTESCIRAERIFLATLQGGCSIPVFGLASHVNGRISLTAGIVSLDGQKELRRTEIADTAQANSMAQKLADKIASQGGNNMVREIRANL